MSSDSHEPYLLLGTARREQLEKSLRHAVDEWRGQWGSGASSPLNIEIAPLFSRLSIASSGPRQQVFEVTSGARGLLLTAAFAAEAPADLLGISSPRVTSDGPGEAANAVLHKAMHALCVQIGRAALKNDLGDDLSVTLVSAERTQRDPLQGRTLQVIVRSNPDRPAVRLQLFPTFVAALLPSSRHKASEPLASRRGAVATQSIALQAVLGEAEVALAELARLQVGDVILLNTLVSGSAQLSLPDGRVLAQARLGSSDGRRAVSAMTRPAGQSAR